MKKILIVFCALCITSIGVNANEVLKPSQPALQQKAMNSRIQRYNAFEKRLGLTDIQKAQAKEIRQKGHQELRPVIEQIKVKKQEAEMVKRSRMAVQMQEEKLAQIDEELKVLEKKANKIRKSNMKEFESILTKQQKRILKDMKKEGRRKYHTEHPSNMQKMLQSQKQYKH